MIGEYSFNDPGKKIALLQIIVQHFQRANGGCSGGFGAWVNEDKGPNAQQQDDHCSNGTGWRPMRRLRLDETALAHRTDLRVLVSDDCAASGAEPRFGKYMADAQQDNSDNSAKREPPQDADSQQLNETSPAKKLNF